MRRAKEESAMMNYFKLAVVLVRTWGALWLVLATIGLAWSGFRYIRWFEAVVPVIVGALAGPLWYLIAGSTVFLLSRPIARFLSNGLD